jgi:hypothetical protein
MANPDVLGRHSAPTQYAGTIHFRGQWAYLENMRKNMRKSDCSLLQFDSPFTGVVNPTVAATTAARLQSSYHEGDQVIFHGVLSDQSFGVVAFSVLFVCQDSDEVCSSFI